MSVENFFLRYPADRNLKSTMFREKLPNMSPVATFAAKLAKDAGDGLREIAKKLDNSDTAFGINNESFQRLTQEDKEKMAINHAGVFVGVSIQTLEDCVINGSFDLGLWCSLYNTATNGTQISAMNPVKGQNNETLSRDHLQKMRDLARKDKTFAIFFEDGLESTPSSLRNILVRSEILTVIQRIILPPFKERANFLVI